MYCSSQNFWNMCLETYQLELAHFLTAPGLIWQRAFQKLKVKLDLFTDLDMLLMVQKCIINGICHAVYRYVEFKKYIKKYYEKKTIIIS